MKKVAEGEILIHTQRSGKNVEDLRQNIFGLRGEMQRGSISTQGLARSFLGVNSSVGLTNKSLMVLGRAGAVGAAVALTYKAVMGVAEGLNNMSEEAKQSGKAMDKAFSSGLSARSIEGVSSAIESLKEQEEALDKQSKEVNFFRMAIRGVETLTGLDLGGKRIETDLEQIRIRIQLLQKQQELRKQEEAELFKIRKREQQIFGDREKSAMNARRERLLGGRETVIERGEAEKAVDFENEKLSLAEKNLEIMKQRYKISTDDKSKLEAQRAINEAEFALAKQRLEVEKAKLNVSEKYAKTRKEEFKTASGFGAEILESTAAGRGALETARRKRRRLVRDENYRIAEFIAPTQAERESLAAEVAATEQTTLLERLRTAGTQLPPEMLAAKRAGQRGRLGYDAFLPILEFMRTGGRTGKTGRDVGTGFGFNLAGPSTQTQGLLEDISDEIEALNRNLSTAPLVTSGSGR